MTVGTAAVPPATIADNAAARTTAAAAARLLGPWSSRRMYNTWITQSCRRATLSFSLRLLRSGDSSKTIYTLRFMAIAYDVRAVVVVPTAAEVDLVLRGILLPS